MAAPFVNTAYIDTAGLSLIVGFDQTIVEGAGGLGGFTVAGLSISNPVVSGAAVTFDTDVVYSGDSIANVFYVQPGDGVENAGGEDVASFNRTVLNFSGRAAPSGQQDFSGKIIKGVISNDIVRNNMIVHR